MSKLSKKQREMWAEHIQLWRKSGLSQQAYCETNNLVPNQFWYWKSKLDKSSKKKAPKVKPTPPKDTPFVPVTVNPVPNAFDNLVLTLPNGANVTGITQNNIQTVKQLMEALK